MTLSPTESLQSAPRRVSKPDGIIDNGSTVTVHVQGKTYELNDSQLDEAAARVVTAGAHRPRAGTIAVEQLRSVIERIEQLEEEKAELASDIKDVFAEAKGNGLDVPTLRKILKLRKMDASEREEADYLLATYSRALGLQPDLFEETA